MSRTREALLREIASYQEKLAYLERHLATADENLVNCLKNCEHLTRRNRRLDAENHDLRVQLGRSEPPFE